MKVQKIEDCRKIYRDIVAGYTSVKSPRCFIKHLRETDLGSLENRNDAILEELKLNNIPSEKEVLAALDRREIWTKANEEEHFTLIQAIKDLENEKRKIVSREQAEQLLVVINKERERLYEMMGTREGHLSISREFFLRKKAQQELIKISFFKDEQLTTPYFTTEEFDNIDYKGLNEFFGLFNEMSETFSESNIRKISVTPFFLNSLSLAENATDFFGKSVTCLSIYEIDLFNHGKVNKSILEQCTNTIENYSDLDKVILFFDTEYSLLLGRLERERKQAAHSQH